LRSATRLIQTAGRAARHINGEVILYADVMTQSIKKFLAVTDYRRQKQLAYNQEHHITPRGVSRAVEESLAVYHDTHHKAEMVLREVGGNLDIGQTLLDLQEEMLEAANHLQFEKAALLRDQIRELKRGLGGEGAGENEGSIHLRQGYGGQGSKKLEGGQAGGEKVGHPPVSYKPARRGRKQRVV
jgi:excinuclease ABC subunit B